MNEEELKHLAGEGVIVRTWYADPDNPGKAKVYTTLPTEEDLDVWADAAFTNGGPLVKLELVWAPKEAEQIKAQQNDDRTDASPNSTSA